MRFKYDCTRQKLYEPKSIFKPNPITVYVSSYYRNMKNFQNLNYLCIDNGETYHENGNKIFNTESNDMIIILSSHISLGPATRCNAIHPQRKVLKPLRCIKIACDALRCIFQQVGHFSPDFGISQLHIVI